ncbi:hypothetical protein [Serratia ficaria]|uniref:hypothetical protein n=1 Tax=Serratia ficaria TaxID=61651 RepID=UPI00217AC03D|nr:hypothetical protein [Serratia ficaria]CAI1574704.1 Uncharacterised protein [Serratia ficaria]
MKIITEGGMTNNIKNSITAFSLSLLIFSTHNAMGATVNKENLWNFISNMQNHVRETNTGNVQKFAIPVRIASENEYTKFYVGDAVSLLDGIEISDIDLRISKVDKKSPAFFSFSVSGSCITLDEVKKYYGELELTDYPTGRSLEERSSYTTGGNQYGQHISFGFSAKKPQCLSQVVIDSDE